MALIEYKDKLARFDFSYLEIYIKLLDCPKILRRRDERKMIITTIPGCLFGLTEEMKKILTKEMNNYCFMFRHAFKRTKDGAKKGEVEKEVAALTKMNIRFAKDATKAAVDLITSRKVLMKDYLSLWKKRYENSLARYEFLVNKIQLESTHKKILGLQNKLEKQQRKINHYQQHVDNGTYDTVVFGGRKNFERRCKNLITKEEWQECRNGRLYSRGDKTRKGNPNLRIIEKDGRFYLEISLSNPTQVGKVLRYEKMTCPLYIASKKSKKTGNINGRQYVSLMKNVLASGEAYTIEILKRNGTFRVHITVLEETPTLQTFPKNGYKGADTNPDGVALCHVLANGNPKSFKWFGDGGFSYYRSDKRENRIFEMCHDIIKDCLNDGTGLVVENLSFKKDKEVSQKTRRMVHSFTYRKILETLERLCKRYGVELIKVHPAYTSLSGKLKYQQKYRVSVHESAALVIARRGMEFEEKVPIKLITILTKQQKRKWKQQHEWSRWNTLKKRITNLLKKQQAFYPKWFHYRKLYVK